MPFYTQGDREGRELFEGIVARTYWGENLLLAVVDVTADGVVPPHSHPHEQAGIILEGEVIFTIGGQTQRLKPGDVYVIPGGVEHSVTAGDMPCKVLDIFSPVREEYKY